VEFEFTSPSRIRGQLAGSGLAVSPDGRAVAYVAREGAGPWRLWVRRFGDAEARALAGTDEASYPFWSPDSQHVGYGVAKTLYQIAVAGGPPRKIVDDPDPVTAGDGIGFVGTWGRDGTILFKHRGTGVYRVPAAGGAATPVELKLPEGFIGSNWPHFLPDGRRFLLPLLPFRGTPGGRGGSVPGAPGALLLAALGSADGETIGEIRSPVAYSNGHVLYLPQDSSVIMARPFDPDRGTFTGDPFPVSDGGSALMFSASPNGALATSSRSLKRKLVWWRDGHEVGMLGEPAYYNEPRISPDGSRVAVVMGASYRDINALWIFDERGVPNRFASGQSPVWSPDGKRVAYREIPDRGPNSPVQPPGGLKVVTRLADGTGEAETVSEGHVPMDWSSVEGGSVLLFPGPGPRVTARVAQIASLVGNHDARTWLEATAAISDGRFSPNGRWIAFASTELGATEVFVAPSHRGDAKQRVSVGGGAKPRWVKGGAELYYLAGRSIKAVSIQGTATTMNFGAVRTLFTVPDSITVDSFDVTRDGQRFLLVVSDESLNRPTIVVTTNWLAGVKARR
jgi:hypothetical protein